MKRNILLTVFLSLFIVSCGRGVDTLPCEHYNFGVIDIINSTDRTHYGAYCEVREDVENCVEGSVESFIIKPHMLGAVRLRLHPGIYQLLLRYYKDNKKVDQVWEVNIKRCRNIRFHIEDKGIR